jgi:glycosidase
VIDQIDKDWEGDRNCFGPRLHEFIHALFGREKTKHLFTVGECWCDDLEEVKLHCHDTRDELTTLFQFEHTDVGRTEKFTAAPAKLRQVRDILIRWEELCQEHELIYSLFTDNHDQAQFISRIAHVPDQRYEVATCVASMFYTLRGIPFIYQGQEFGMISPRYDSIDDFDDIESKNYYSQLRETMSAQDAIAKINFGSRDNTRRPMCWDDSEFGGFSEVQPWIKPHSMVKELNLKNDLAAEKSVFRFYQKLLAQRRGKDALILGDVRFLSKQEDNHLATLRSYGDERILIVCNFEQSQKIVTGFEETELLLSNYADRCDGAEDYRPFEIAIYRI